MTDEDLLRRIRLGEDSTLEFKSVLVSGGSVKQPKRDAFADELAAFANSRGGTVILGVDDKTRRVRGIPLGDMDAVEGWVREICNDSVKPALDADILKRELESTEGRPVPVLRIDVARSLFVHKSPGGYFRRIGSSRREMAPEVLARLFQERSQNRIIRFDESAVPGTAPSDLHYSLTRRFLQGDADDEPPASPPEDSPEASEDTLRKLRIVTDDADGRARLTLTGVLLCTPEPQRWLPHAYIPGGQLCGRAQRRRLPDRCARRRGAARPAGCRSAAFRAAEHAGASHQAHRALGAPPVQRAGRIRGAGERGGPSRLFDGRRPGAPAPVRRPPRAPRSRRAGQHPDPGEPGTCGSRTGTSSSSPCWRVAPRLPAADARG